MKFSVFWNKCRQCGFEFETLSDPGLYSSRLLLSEETYLPAIAKCDDDPAFSEVYKIVDRILKPKGYTSLQIATHFDEIFSSICDLAPDGSRYNMTGRKNCPKCGSREIDFGPHDPQVYREENPPEIKHKQWDLLNITEKEFEIVKRIKFGESG